MTRYDFENKITTAVKERLQEYADLMCNTTVRRYKDELYHYVQGIGDMLGLSLGAIVSSRKGKDCIIIYNTETDEDIYLVFGGGVI